jgi:hypothetical protein
VAALVSFSPCLRASASLSRTTEHSRGAWQTLLQGLPAMHSFWQRLNAIFFFALSVLGFLSFLGAGMTYWHVSTPRIELTLEKIVLRKIYGARGTIKAAS